MCFRAYKRVLRGEGWKSHCFREAAEEEKFGVVTVLGSLRENCANVTNAGIS